METQGLSWEQTCERVAAAYGAILGKAGYKFVKSSRAFHKPTAQGRLELNLGLQSTRYGRFMRVQPAHRCDAIMEAFHRTSGVDPKHHKGWSTIFISAPKVKLDTDAEVDQACADAGRQLKEWAMPFLECEYSMQDYVRILNCPPGDDLAKIETPVNLRKHFGLIAARLANDPQYASLKKRYLAAIAGGSNAAFYLPRFQALVADLER